MTTTYDDAMGEACGLVGAYLRNDPSGRDLLMSRYDGTGEPIDRLISSLVVLTATILTYQGGAKQGLDPRFNPKQALEAAGEAELRDWTPILRAVALRMDAEEGG